MKKMKRHVLIVNGILSLAFALISSCDPVDVTTISGIVTDSENYPLNGVNITVGDETITTMQTGAFLFEGLQSSGDFFKVGFEKDGYFSITRIVKSKKEIEQLQVALIKHGKSDKGQSVSKSIDATNGGAIKLDDGSIVQLKANSIANGKGNIKVKFAQYTPDQYVFPSVLPGDGRLLGKDADGSEFLIYAFSMFVVELFDMNDNLLQLAENQLALLEFAIPSEIIDKVPEQMSMFYYDEELAYWVEEGIATKEGNKYTGNVSHFSFWKLGKKTKETATVNGKVIDRNGRPIVGQNVRIDQVSAVTDNNGYFEAKVLPDHEFLVGMNYKGFEIKMDAGPIAAGQTQTIDLSVPPMTYVVGTIADCDNNPKRGQANLSWGEPEFSNLYTKNGNFELSIPSAVKNSTLTLTVGKFSVKQKVENADKKAEINVGTIVVCDTSQINTELEDTDKNKEEKKPVKVDKPKIEGRYNFTGRSDNQSLVNYHYIELSANGKYIEKYQPKNSPNYVGGTEGTWKVSGDKLILTTASGSVADTYTIKGNKLIYESGGGIIFTFSK